METNKPKIFTDRELFQNVEGATVQILTHGYAPDTQYVQTGRWTPASEEQSEARCDRKARAMRVLNVMDPVTRKVSQMHIPVGGGMDFLIKAAIEDAAKAEKLRLAKRAERERKRALYAKRYHRYGARRK